jgi:uncharacterized protein (TIGR02145 family)
MDEIVIGNQIWSNSNLKSVAFTNGDKILECKNKKEWLYASKNKIPAFCCIDFNSENEGLFGKLYNFYAVIDERGIAPDGWKIPSKNDWEDLIKFLGVKPALKLKSKTGWYNPIVYGSIDGTDDYGFNAVPGYAIDKKGEFAKKNKIGVWWSDSIQLKITDCVYSYALADSNGDLIGLFSFGYSSMSDGLSIRLIKK